MEEVESQSSLTLTFMRSSRMAPPLTLPFWLTGDERSFIILLARLTTAIKLATRSRLYQALCYFFS